MEVYALFQWNSYASSFKTIEYFSSKSYKTTTSPDHRLHSNKDFCDAINDEVKVKILWAIIQLIFQLTLKWLLFHTHLSSSTLWKSGFQLHYQWIHLLMYFLNTAKKNCMMWVSNHSWETLLVQINMMFIASCQFGYFTGFQHELHTPVNCTYRHTCLYHLHLP